MRASARLLLAATIGLLCARTLSAQSLVVSADHANQHRGVVRFIEGLADRELEDAVRSGLPLRVRFRVELWKDGFIDDLLGAEQWTTVLTFDALSEQYVLRTRAAAGKARFFSDYRSARAAIEGAYVVSMRPSGTGRYYYTAVVYIETLSLSDLEELERWLKGELQPAVSGDRSIPGALGQGARRLFMRVLALPERRFEGRSDRFRIP
ncbi:MAG: DUF4390 domain-containing protein [Gemmatimonadota bacterium]